MCDDNCLLNKFPVEIVHIIFDYLSAVDILNGFLKQSFYIDSIIDNYNFYKINFRSILKSDFDLICNYIKPSRIKSLILSDGIDTPSQSNLYLSLFKLEQFYLSLNCLSLIQINDESLKLITNHLDKFNSLSSLTITNSNLTGPPTLMNIFPRLIRLNIPSQWFFPNVTVMPRLQHLIISDRCTFIQLDMIIRHAQNLISLNICLERESGANIHGITSNLTKLVLNMSQIQMNMIEMKELLKCFPCLIEFEVECRSDIDLLDGNEWEKYLLINLSKLKKFNFKFQIKSPIVLNIIVIQNILRSYSSSYWLNEKKWYIGIEWDQRLIYSVPRFSCESGDQNFRPPIHKTSIDDKIYYDNINALALWGETKDYFPHVKELWLIDDPSKINFSKMIDVNRVERLIFASSKNDFSIEILINLISKMTKLYFIQFCDLPIEFNEEKQEICMKQIRSIELIRELKSLSSIKILNKFFPQIERLNMKIKSNEDIHFILNSFSNSLSIVTFHCDTSNLLINQKFLQKILGHSNFTFEIDLNSIKLWIGSKQSFVRFEIEERKSVGCFSCFSKRKSLFKRC